ncbi:uncharacterized protein LOC113376716 [Ctenocephalides felis]|uniref:uncharacterized protein LOC113376716 n=1 Tax=Ctenocephalides felis TaxID=7515 RepID=UPI000E6E1DDF|nr:uncharacterized protein LOC113376716 [Ctenocephalides felis]
MTAISYATAEKIKSSQIPIKAKAPGQRYDLGVLRETDDERRRRRQLLEREFRCINAKTLDAPLQVLIGTPNAQNSSALPHQAYHRAYLAASEDADNLGYADNTGERISLCQLRTSRSRYSNFSEEPTFICNSNQAGDYMPRIQRITYQAMVDSDLKESAPGVKLRLVRNAHVLANNMN